MDPTLLYCYDAYCGWCYGFSPVIKDIRLEYKDKFHIEVLSGGLVLPGTPVHISATASYIRTVYKNVENLTGIKFGEDYLWHINNPGLSDWYPDSEKPAIALCVFKEYYPDQQLQFATDLQYALHAEGRDLNDDEAYRHLLLSYNIPVRDFYEKLNDPVFRENAHYEFALVKQLKVTGYPTVFIQISKSKFYLVARGYSDYDALKEKIEEVLNETNSSNLKINL